MKRVGILITSLLRKNENTGKWVLLMEPPERGEISSPGNILRRNFQPESVSTRAGVRRNCKSEGLLVWPTGAALLVNEEDRSGSIILGQF